MSENISPRPLSQQQEKRLRDFYERADLLGMAPPREYFWYHSIDLGSGLITPGVYDLRAKWPQYYFPDDFEGLRVLDIGAATGFFSFQFAQRGAEVTATELPHLQALDSFPGQDQEIVMQKAFKYMQGYVLAPPTDWQPEAVYHCLLQAPFAYCQEQLGLEVTRLFTSIYDLGPNRQGSFDWVFLGDVLLHTLRPLEALSAAASVCRGTLVLAQELSQVGGDTPLLVYTGGEHPEDDESAWWMPNEAWLRQLFRKLGFREVVVKGSFEDVYLPVGQKLTRTVIHASR